VRLALCVVLHNSHYRDVSDAEFTIGSYCASDNLPSGKQDYQLRRKKIRKEVNNE